MPARDGLELVRALLGRALVALPLSPRKIEDALQIGHGTLPRLLDGRMDLKLRHLLPLCGVLQIHPSHLLERGLPNWEATRRIDDWLPPDHRKSGPARRSLQRGPASDPHRGSRENGTAKDGAQGLTPRITANGPRRVLKNRAVASKFRCRPEKSGVVLKSRAQSGKVPV